MLYSTITRHISRAATALAVCIFICPGGIMAKRVTTKVRVPAQASANADVKIKTYPRHTSEFEKVKQGLTFMAYDKKASSDRETFFVDNGSKVGLSAIEVEISYFNLDGKLIHKRVVEVRQDFPALETRKVDITSWDRQKSFHYINSVPSNKGSAPYTVRFKVISFTEAYPNQLVTDK